MTTPYLQILISGEGKKKVVRCGLYVHIVKGCSGSMRWIRDKGIVRLEYQLDLAGNGCLLLIFFCFFSK